MNILFTIHSLTGGGAERVCASVANGLSRLGHNVKILVGDTSEYDYFVEKDVEVICLHNNYKGKYNIISKCCLYLLRKIKYILTLHRLLKKRKTDAVINIIGYHLVSTIAVCKLHGVITIFSDHNSYERPDYAPMRFQQRFQKFYLSRLCDQTTVLTDRDKQVLANRKNVSVMPNPLFLPISNNVPEKKKTILAVGRYDAWHVKGFDILIQAWGNICADYPDWTLRIVGKGSENSVNTIQSFITESKAERVELAPFRNDIVEEYKRSEIFVLSSRYEGFGLVLTEAMSQRCACIACDYKGRQSEIITDGRDGLICETDNAEALSEKLLLLLANDNLRHTLQSNAAANLNRYSEENIAISWEKLLNKLSIEK